MLAFALLALPAAGPASAQSHGRAPAQLPGQEAPAGAAALSLPEAVYLGLRNNRVIRSEYLQRVADRFALRVEESRFTPRLDIAATTNRSRSAGVNTTAARLGPVLSWDAPTGARLNFGWQAAQTNIRGQPGNGAGNLSFELVQPLLAGAGIDYATAPLRIARISEQNARLRVKQTVSEQVTSIVLAYRTLLQSQEQLRIAEDGLRRARELVEVNRLLIAAGRLAQVEIVQSEASVAQQELALLAAQNANEEARLALLVLIAADPASRIWAADRPSAPSVRVDLQRALATAYANQPAYLGQLFNIEINRINLDAARNQRLWELNIVAGAGQQATRRNVLDTVDALRQVRSDFNIGLQLNIPIGYLAREQLEVNATTALRQSELAAEQARDALRKSVEDGVRNVETQRRQAELARRARELARQQLEVELARLQAGRSSNFQVVSFQSALQQAESAELGAVIAYLNALNQLDLVLGTVLETWQITLNE
ncbi:TolC family protein [Pararoseomonas baculiformis]|nr:TolC family protein [Pararoseomonas baculiformis]